MTVVQPRDTNDRMTAVDELVLEPVRADKRYWHDVRAYRELFAILAWRDVAIRYKQTVVGVAWAVVRPFLTMIVFTIDWPETRIA